MDVRAESEMSVFSVAKHTMGAFFQQFALETAVHCVASLHPVILYQIR